MPALLPHPALALTVRAPEFQEGLAVLAASYRMPVCWVVEQASPRWAHDLASLHEIGWQLPAAMDGEALTIAKAQAAQINRALCVAAVSRPMSPALGEGLLKAGVLAVCSSHVGQQPRRIRFGLWEFPAALALSLDAGRVSAWRQRRALVRLVQRLAQQGGVLRVVVTAEGRASAALIRRRFEQTLKVLCRARDLGHIRVEPISDLARQLSHRPRPTAAQSILRSHAA